MIEEELFLKIKNSIIDIFVSATKRRVKQAFNENKLRMKLNNYIENQQKYNKICNAINLTFAQ